MKDPVAGLESDLSATTRTRSFGRCVVCNAQCTLYICLTCAANSPYFGMNRSEFQAATATSVSAVMQYRVERETGHDHFLAMNSHYVEHVPVAEGEVGSAACRTGYDWRIAKATSGARFSAGEHRRWNEILDTLTPTSSFAWRLSSRRRAGLARRKYAKFCEVWNGIGLAAWTDTLAVKKPRLVRIGAETLSRIAP